MKALLLDTSFLIDFAQETEAGLDGPARRTLARLGTHRVYLSAVSVAEFLEGADDEDAALAFLRHMQPHFQPLGWAVARRCAVAQGRAARRMGENDAWQAALAVVSGHQLIGHDSAFEGRPNLDYLDHRRP